MTNLIFAQTEKETKFRGEAFPAGSVFFIAHLGSSMNPTLCDLDLLEIMPCDVTPVRVGDVIMFSPPGQKQPVVHRVVQCGDEGVRTRGDNSPNVDPWLVSPEDIAGRVVAARRGRRRRKIAGGLTGRMLADATRCMHLLNRTVSRLLHPVYRLPSLSGILHRLLPSRIRPRLVAFQAEGENHFRIILGRQVIGTYNSQLRRWKIRRPFRLFVDDASLPK